MIQFLQKMRCKCVWGIFFVLLCVCGGLIFNCAAYAEEYVSPEDLHSKAAVLLDAESKRVLYSKNGDLFLANASTTKIMTCILILENGNTDDTTEVSAYAAGMPAVKLSVRKGECYRVEDLLYSLMLESHNDSAVVLAEYLGRKLLAQRGVNFAEFHSASEESKACVAAFAELMNAKAEELGCLQSYFITPNGLDATAELTDEEGNTVTKEHGTTAAELAKIMAYCITDSSKKDRFLTITQTRQYSFTANKRSFSLVNHNSLLDTYAGAVSGKTGYTGKAGYCYVGAADRNGKVIVTALLACGWPNHKTWKWKDAKKLLSYGMDHYEYYAYEDVSEDINNMLAQGIPVDNAAVTELGNKKNVELALEKNITGGGILLGEGEEITMICKLPERLQAPIKKGEVISNLCYMLNGVVYRQQNIVAAENVEKRSIYSVLRQIWLRFLPEL